MLAAKLLVLYKYMFILPDCFFCSSVYFVTGEGRGGGEYIVVTVEGRGDGEIRRVIGWRPFVYFVIMEDLQCWSQSVSLARGSTKWV